MKDNLILIADANKKILKASSTCKQLGYTPKELVGQSLDIIIKAFDMNEKDATEVVVQGKDNKSILGHYEIIKQNETCTIIIQDLTKIHELKQKIEKYQTELASAKRTEMLASQFQTIIHDLKNKHFAISGFASYLVNAMTRIGEKTQDDELKELIEDIIEVSDCIFQAINEASEMTHYHLNALKQKKGRRKIDINEIIKQTLIVNKKELKQKGIKAYLNLYDGECTTIGEEEQIFSALLNLINNAKDALEKKQGKKTIRARTYLENDYWISEITDNGPGIPEDKLQKVFEENYTTKPTGNGLGLHLSKKWVERHNGILVYNQDYKEGACFKLILPKIDEEKTEPQTTELENLEGKILLVDEQVHSRKSLKRTIESKGYQVTACSNIERAVQLLKEKEYDAILSDLHISGNGRIELYEAAKNKRKGYEKKLIFSSGVVSPDSTCIKGLPGTKFYYKKDTFSGYELILKLQEAIQEKI